MVFGGCGIILGTFYLRYDDGAASLLQEQIQKFCGCCRCSGGCGHRTWGDIGCGGFGVHRCLHRKKGYGGCGLPAVNDGFRQAVNRLGGYAGDGGLGAAHLTGAAAADGHQEYDGHENNCGDVCVLHGACLM